MDDMELLTAIISLSDLLDRVQDPEIKAIIKEKLLILLK